MNSDTYRAFSATLVGNVQDKGFRAIVKDSGNECHLDGEVFNNFDGTVTLYYGGYNGNISDFFTNVRMKSEGIGVIFDITDKVTLPRKFRLPRGFHIIETDKEVRFLQKCLM